MFLGSLLPWTTERVEALKKPLSAGLPLLLLELHAGERRLVHAGTLPFPGLAPHDRICSLP